MRHFRPLLASLLVAVPAFASAITPYQGGFDVQIFDRTEGRQLPTYQFQGRTYVVGKPGNEYSISLRNQNGERMMAVTSVDGVNIVSGETASPMQSGYVLSPWQTADITGWRKSLTNTAAFYFTDLGDSYAARTGRPNDVGVIGVAVFRERRVQPPMPPVVPYGPSRQYNEQQRDRSSSAPYESSAAPAQPGRADSYSDAPVPPPAGQSGAASAPSSAEIKEYAPRRLEKSLGTGHGRIEDSRTQYTEFRRASSTPDRVITIYYDTYNNLLAMGVPVYRDEYRYGNRQPQPRPFPRDPTLGFVPDPR